MDAHKVLQTLNAGNIAPVYLLHGPEQFIVFQLVARIQELVMQGPMADLNIQRLKGGSVSGSEVSAAARELPMMAPRRMVVVDDAQKLNSQDLETIEPLLAEPFDQTCLVLVADKFDLRRGPILRANKRGQVHKADSLKERDLYGFVQARADVRGFKFSKEAALATAAMIGSDLGAIDDAVERLGLFAGPKDEVREEHVAQVLSSVREHSAFELVDAIGARQSSRATRLLIDLLGQREEPIKINALLARHYRQLLTARIHLHMKTDPKQMASILGVPPFAARKIVDQCRKFRGTELERALLRLSRADVELKSSRRSSDLVLTQAVMDLCNPA